MRLVVALVLFDLLLGGCRKPSVAPTTTCAEAGTNAVDATVNAARARLQDPNVAADARAQITARIAALERLAPRQKAILTNRCVDDKWPASVVACFANAHSLEDTRACRAQLTADQATALQKGELALAGEPLVPAGLSPAPLAPRDPRLVQLLTERNELMKQLAAGSDADGAALRAKIDALSVEIKKLEDAAASTGSLNGDGLKLLKFAPTTARDHGARRGTD